MQVVVLLVRVSGLAGHVGFTSYGEGCRKKEGRGGSVEREREEEAKG